MYLCCYSCSTEIANAAHCMCCSWCCCCCRRNLKAISSVLRFVGNFGTLIKCLSFNKSVAASKSQPRGHNCLRKLPASSSSTNIAHTQRGLRSVAWLLILNSANNWQLTKCASLYVCVCLCVCVRILLAGSGSASSSGILLLTGAA